MDALFPVPVKARAMGLVDPLELRIRVAPAGIRREESVPDKVMVEEPNKEENVTPVPVLRIRLLKVSDAGML